MLAVAALLPGLAVGEGLRWALALSLIASGYAFCFSTTLAAVTGQRGLQRASSTGLGLLVYGANVLAASSSMLAAVLLVMAGGLSLT